MSSVQTEQDALHQASTLSSIAFNNDHIHLLIIGAGRGGMAMLNVMRDYDWVNIYAIVDLNEQAFAFPLAQSLGIQTSTNRHQTLNEFKGDIVIDVTGDSSLAAELTTELENRKTELIAGKSAKLVFDLVHQQLNHTRTIHSQNRRLDLLDSMLEITTQLENQPQLADILHTSLSYLKNHIQAEQSLVLMFDADGAAEISHAEGKEKASSHHTICCEAQAICSDINKLWW